MDVLERVGVGLGAYRCCFLALWGQTDISGLVLSGVSTRRAVRGYQPGRAELTEMAAGTARAATQKTGSCLKDRHRSQTAPGDGLGGGGSGPGVPGRRVGLRGLAWGRR
jgi:hypothetical protein